MTSPTDNHTLTRIKELNLQKHMEAIQATIELQRLIIARPATDPTGILRQTLRESLAMHTQLIKEDTQNI